MKVAVFDVRRFERPFFEEANREFGHELKFYDVRLSAATAPLVFGFDAICPFVNDRVDEEVLNVLRVAKVKLIALRSAGFNNIDLPAAEKMGLPVVRVPKYSPHAVAEFAAGLILCLNRKIHRAYHRVREGDFALEGLVGFDLIGKTVGIVGTGDIGSILCKIMNGFGCRVLAYDVSPNRELPNVEYLPDIKDLYRQSDVISLHLPLTPETKHLIGSEALGLMKPEVILINTGRGGLIDTPALISALKQCRIGAAGLDVYEEEEDCFFRDLSESVIQDDVLARLMTFPNVLITSHQGFLTKEALRRIARTTLENISAFENGKGLVNEVRAGDVLSRAA